MSWLSEGEGLHGVRSDISPSLHSPDSVSLAGVLDLQSGKTLITLFKNNSIGKKSSKHADPIKEHHYRKLSSFDCFGRFFCES